MLWASRLSVGTSYIAGVALPMLPIGFGLGLTLSPLTASGITGVKHQDAGAASGLVNVAHQLGGSLGFAVLVAVFAGANADTPTGSALLAHRIASTFTVGSEMLALALALAIIFIVGPSHRHRAEENATRPPLDTLETESSS